jgi:hypothetical protein
MNPNDKSFICPCCGYDELKSQPYEKNINLPLDKEVSIPYSIHFGEPSYGVCDCCGYEYGNDDEPGTSQGTTFYQYLKEWIADGCNWFKPASKPGNWNIENQLLKAKILKP